jgi:hypothetical protein
VSNVHIVHIRHLWQQLKRGALNILCDKVCQWLAAGRWFSPGTPVSSTNITDCHDITEILLKVALNTITPNPRQWIARNEYKCKCNVAWGLSVCNALYIGNIWLMGFVTTFYNIILFSFCLKLYGWQVFEKRDSKLLPTFYSEIAQSKNKEQYKLLHKLIQHRFTYNWNEI